ncbi:hypothetical protein [Hippea maritima]|uniref:Tfp pilus assembly protein ATPase PilM-like protein n=1 Tax=Hippea maritima (strain ATCC 700847 / DSM 10411 / MH2) TaxID=760142 RepID=F2LWJ6_HIPMA|nr:hypothetical protein [Hippea maritima]AEA34105.1 hypothetical protein Hipma_1139 [Hippea maritima DSM 10411]
MDFNLRCSIAIGPSEIDVCLIRKKGKNSVIESLAFYEFEDEKEINNIIDSIAENLPKDVLTNVSFKHSSIIEHIYFYKSNSDIRSSLYKDLKRDYEIELKDYIIDYEENKFEEKNLIYVAAMPRSVLNFYYSILSKHKNIKLYSFETHSVSLRRVVGNFLGDGYILGCAIFKDYSTISACKDGKALAFRNLRYSWNELVGSLAKSGGISKKEAENLLQKKGFETVDEKNQEEQLIYESISGVFDQFTIEIQRTIDYITTVQKIGKIEKIVTIGQINKVNNINKYISRLFSLETVEFKPQKLIEFGQDIDSSILDNTSYFEICVGAALREIK